MSICRSWMLFGWKVLESTRRMFYLGTCISCRLDILKCYLLIIFLLLLNLLLCKLFSLCLQLCSGIDENAVEVGGGGTRRVANDLVLYPRNLWLVQTIAFQFTFKNHLRENVTAMAQQYIRSVVASFQWVAMAISPSRLCIQIGMKHTLSSPQAHTLLLWISQSFRFHTRVRLIIINSQAGETLKLLWHYFYAIMCYSLRASPLFTFTNQAGLDLLETTPLEKILDNTVRKVLCTEFPKIMQQGFAYLLTGIFMSSIRQSLSYE
ncbi:hypothetical protein IEQ34_004814 [Dendrobium chrysotoxum]|uniref:MEKHLA domain-containing protein n=1 Tax=Dendrobium chrysotoxum TaxID=161865 RepID=A0AAV7H731_DENCH|nr:hypothetical protein IEQ34_004814 [Dendrobium chrysotoxum]